MAHRLKIKIEDVFEDPRYIRVIDWSEYSTVLELTNRVLKVEVPGLEDFKIVNIPVKNSAVYTTKSLKISKQLEDLNDGLWRFTYSVCPNEKVYTVVTHFRAVLLQSRLYNLISKMVQLQDDSSDEALCSCLLKLEALKADSIDDYNVQRAYDLYTDIERIIDNVSNRINSVV